MRWGSEKRVLPGLRDRAWWSARSRGGELVCGEGRSGGSADAEVVHQLVEGVVDGEVEAIEGRKVVGVGRGIVRGAGTGLAGSVSNGLRGGFTARSGGGVGGGAAAGGSGRPDELFGLLPLRLQGGGR